jgi:glutaredoxin 2
MHWTSFRKVFRCPSSAASPGFPALHQQEVFREITLVQPRGNKSLFASFSSEKEDSSFFEKKEAKKLLSLPQLHADASAAATRRANALGFDGASPS